jgi:uncharacterized protein (TIGR00251 family)
VTDRPALLDVTVVARASRNAVRVDEDGSVRVWVTRPPADGQANQAVLEVLAHALHHPPSALALVSGTRSRRKRIEVRGLPDDEIRARLADRR